MQTFPATKTLRRDASVPGKTRLCAQKIQLVEAARGFAAVYVMVGHVLAVTGAATRWPHLAQPFHLLGYGHQFVILFFLLSGFSIHYSSLNRSMMSLSDCLDYYYRRFRRIYPLVLLSLIAALLLLAAERLLGLPDCAVSVSPSHILPTALLLSDLGTTTGHWFATTLLNSPLWSLSYEVIYYLIYPAFWLVCRRIGVGRAFGLSVGISIFCVLLDRLAIPNHLCNIFALYWIWCLGAVVGEWRLRHQIREWRSSFYYPALMSLLVCAVIVEKFEQKFLSDWCYGGLFGLMMISFALRLIVPKSRIWCLLAISSLSCLGWMMCDYLQIPGSHALIKLRLAGAVLAIGMLIYGGSWISIRKVCSLVLSPFTFFGKCSYGIYIFHWPILAFAMHISQALHLASGLLLALVTTSGFLVAIPIAYWMEICVQPAVASRMDNYCELMKAWPHSSLGA